MLDIWKPSTWEVEEGSRVSNHPLLHSEFESILIYMRLCLNTQCPWNLHGGKRTDSQKLAFDLPTGVLWDLLPTNKYF